jgi:uncharacterized membrane protein
LEESQKVKIKHLIQSRGFVHKAFEVGIFLKGLDGLLEVIGGALVFVIKPSTINNIVMALLQHELSEDPSDLIANYLIYAAHHFSVETQVFASLYLLSHGIIKIFLVVSLWQGKLWSYPTAIVFFILFILYQGYRYSYTHSSWLIFLTIVDLFVVLLTWIEYKHVRLKGL